MLWVISSAVSDRTYLTYICAYFSSSGGGGGGGSLKYQSNPLLHIVNATMVNAHREGEGRYAS